MIDQAAARTGHVHHLRAFVQHDLRAHRPDAQKEKPVDSARFSPEGQHLLAQERGEETRPEPAHPERVATERFGGRDRAVIRRLAAERGKGADEATRPEPAHPERVATERFGGRDRSVIRRLAAERGKGAEEATRPEPAHPERVATERFGGRDRSVLRRLDRS